MRKLIICGVVVALGLLAGCTVTQVTPAPAPVVTVPAQPDAYDQPTFANDPAPEIPCITPTADMQVELGMGDGAIDEQTGKTLAEEGAYDYIG